MSITQTILFGIVVLITHFLEGITGFGCTVLALPFATSLAGIKTAVPVLVIIAWILALYIVIIDFKNIVWKEYAKIVSFVLLGLPIGMWLFSSLPDVILKKFLGIFMIVVAVRGLYAAFSRGKEVAAANLNGCCIGSEVTSKKSFKSYILNFVLFLGGIIHGAFGSGGPFIVIYATKALPDKSKFRATLCALWFTLNTIIITKNVVGGVMTTPIVKLLGWTIPFLIAGMILGNIAHNKINGESFVKVVYMVLLLSGVFMVI